MSFQIRPAASDDYEATRRLVVAAFHDNEPEETAVFLDALRADGCVLGEWVAEDASGVLGHVVFSRVWIEADTGGKADAAMLTPLAVRPDRQRCGVGTALVLAALDALQARGESLFLVLGHPGYYPRLGFHAALAKDIRSDWGETPAFMARCAAPLSGRLILPRAIAEAH